MAKNLQNHGGTFFGKIAYLLLGRLLRVDLITSVGLKCLHVRTSVRLSTKSFFDFDEIWYTGSTR